MFFNGDTPSACSVVRLEDSVDPFFSLLLYDEYAVGLYCFEGVLHDESAFFRIVREFGVDDLAVDRSLCRREFFRRPEQGR